MGKLERTEKKQKYKNVEISVEQKKKIKRKLLPQFIYIIVVFLPFCYHLWITYDVMDEWVSLSRIGWRPEIGGAWGWLVLVLFVLLTGPFLVYQVWFYLKNRTVKKKSYLLLYLTIAAAVIIAAGASMPYYVGAKKLLMDLHNFFAMLGALLAVMAITIIMTQVCRESARETILVLYALFAMVVVYIYGELRNGTAFQIGLVFIMFVIMYWINSVVLRRNAINDIKKKKVPSIKEVKTNENVEA